MSGAKSLSAKLLGPTVATLCGVALLANLGFWQLRRLEEKTVLLDKIEARTHQPPLALANAAAWLGLVPETVDYVRAQASGTFLHEDEALVFEPAAKGATGIATKGFSVLTPLKLDDGSIIIVDRGFVPEDLGPSPKRAAAQLKGKVTVSGALRTAQRRGVFTPDDKPEAAIWYTRDPTAIARAFHLDHVAPFYLEADATPNPGGWPKGGDSQITIPNRHLEYALTWFGLAATLICFYLFFAWVQWRETAKNTT